MKSGQIRREWGLHIDVWGGTSLRSGLTVEGWCMAELEVSGTTWMDHTVSWVYRDKGTVPWLIEV